MFTLPEHFDDNLAMIFNKSVFFWQKQGIKNYEIEHLLYSLIKEKNETILKVFEKFSINPDIISNSIMDGSFFKDYSSTIQDPTNVSMSSNLKFSPSFVEVATQAFISVSASNPLNTVISTDCMVLNICISEASRLRNYFDNLGISSDVLKDFIINIEDVDIEDAIDSLLNKDDDIMGSSSGDTATDTLDPNPNGKKHKPERAKNISTSDRSVMNLFCTNMLDDVKNGKIGPVIGREKEVEMIEEILCRKNKRNALLLGDPGTGKTCLVEKLAIEMYNGNVPLELRNKRLFSFNVNSIVSGTRYRGDFEERMKAMMDEIVEKKDVILSIDEFHMIIGAGGNSNNDMSNILKPALARGDMQIIACCTTEEYSRFILKDKALERRFQIIQIDEPNEEESKLILQGLRHSYEDYHRVSISDNAIDAAIRYSKQYMPARYAPDKCIDLIDIAGARTKMKSKEFPDDIKQLQKQLSEIHEKMDGAAKAGRIDVSKKYKEKAIKLESKIKEKEDVYIKSLEDNKPTITEEDIANVVSRLTDIPTDKISQSNADKLLKLEEVIKEKLVGQDEAVSSVCKCIRRNMSGLKDPKKPIGVFLFAGGTGCGKTELCRCLATELFGKEANLLKFDMSAYSENIDVSKLLGSSPGFVGYEEGGKLTEAVRKTPYSIVLLDEIEKAHKDIYNIFLSIFEDGEITDAKGRTVYFNNAIIIMTSNIGAEEAFNSKGDIGFNKLDSKEEADNKEYERAIKIMKKECENHFTPEFLNRIDNIIFFNKLSHDSLMKITDLQIGKLNERIKHRNIKIVITDSLRERIIEKGYDPKYGARPINRAIQEILGDYMAEKLLKKEIDDGMEVEFDYDKDKEEVTHKVLKEIHNNDSNQSINFSFEDDEFSKLIKENLK